MAFKLLFRSSILTTSPWVRIDTFAFLLAKHHHPTAQNCALRDAREQLARSSVAAQCAPAVVREPPATWRYTVDLGGPLDDPRWRRQEADKAACPTAAEVRALTEELSVQDLQVQLEDARAQLRAMQALKRQVMHAVHHLKHRAAAKEASAQ